MSPIKKIDTDPGTHEQSPAPSDTVCGGIGQSAVSSIINEREQPLMNLYTGTELEKLASKFDHPNMVDGRNMNVNIQGDGDRTAVLLQGRGTTAPALDFKPLTDELLNRGFRVVVPEFFGSGLSDMTDKPRTPEQIVKEVHEALQQLGIKDYDLVGHSLAGIQALEFAKLYPDEVLSFTGIDTATPGMSAFITPELEEVSAAYAPPETLPTYVYSPEQQAVMKALEERNTHNDDKLSQITKTAGGDANDLPSKFRAGLPVHFFLSGDSVNIADASSPEKWFVSEHIKQVPNGSEANVTVLPGEHYLHQNQPVAIAAGIANLR